MLNGNYVSIYEIIERVFDTFDSESIEFSTMVRHIADALLLIGVNSSLDEKVSIIPIQRYRGALPKDIIYIKQVRDCNTKEVLRESANSFHKALEKRESDLTYKVNKEYIFTNFEEGEIEIAYTALVTDEKGFPMIPDDIKFIKAVESYLMERIAFKLYLQDKIKEVKYNRLAQEKDWYVGAAISRGSMPSVDKMEMIKNAYSRLINNSLSHSKFFSNLGDAEKFRVHG